MQNVQNQLDFFKLVQFISVLYYSVNYWFSINVNSPEKNGDINYKAH